MRYIDATAPEVIDEELCRQCIHLLQPRELSQGVEADTFRQTTANKQATLPFGDVECLMFSFKNILKINNLVGFDKLVKLYLDNNVIVKIENLDHLVNLEWLDLSFNNIDQISGLSHLTKLENLSLFNNRIEALDGLDALVDSLQVLSVGNNRLSDLEQTKSLRKFHKLQAVTFAGNPLALKDDYRAFVLAHLRHLRFLDYRLVDDQEVQLAESDGALQEKLQEIRLAEQAEEEQREVDRQLAAKSATLQSANMGALDNFWGKMEKETAEHTTKLKLVEELGDMHNKKEPVFARVVDDFVLKNEADFKDKERELRQFQAAATAMKAENNAEAISHIDRFNSKAKEVKRLFAPASSRYAPAVDQERVEEGLEELKVANRTLYDELMELEMMQVDQFIKAIDIFENKYTAMHQMTLAAVGDTFKLVRDLASEWHAEATQLANDLHEKHTAAKEVSNDTDDMQDDVKAVLNDKELMTTSLDAANEVRIAFVDATEDALAKAEKGAFNKIVNDLRESEHRRNRERVNEISNLVHGINQETVDKLTHSAQEAEES